MPRCKKNWGVDSEYLAAGRKIEDDVCNIGFSDGQNDNRAYRSAEDAKQFLEHKRLSRLYTWTLRPEFGTFASWKLLGVEDPTRAVNMDFDSIQRFVIIRSNNRKTVVLDIQPFFKPLGLGSIAKVGKFLVDQENDPTLFKDMDIPDWFGVRKPETETEWQWMDNHVRQDARITSRAATFLESVLLPRFLSKVNLKKYYSWGTISRQYFQFLKINPRMGREVICKNLHLLLHNLSETAGRNDALSTGALPPIFYMDVASLYPVSVVASDCLRIIDVEPMTQSELDAIHEPSDFKPYCWLYGVFEATNDSWGLPCRTEKRNYYVNGRILGLYHTLDLQASKAKIVELFYGLKPIFSNDRTLHDRYTKLTLQKIEGRYVDLLERHGLKQILNDSLGSLGMSDPIGTTSNFPAYGTGLAMSHWIMSQIFDLFANQPIHYCDTDSVFVERKTIEGKVFDLTDLEKNWSIPVILEERAYSENPYIFRSKLYYLNPHNYAVQAIHIEHSDWLKIVQTLPDITTAQRQVKGTIRTRASKAKELQFGRWYYESLQLATDDISKIFKADDKRHRETYDSYALCREKRFIGSRAWTSAEFYQQKLKDDDLAVKIPSEKHYDRAFIRHWLEKYAKSPQEAISFW